MNSVKTGQIKRILLAGNSLYGLYEHLYLYNNGGMITVTLLSTTHQILCFLIFLLCFLKLCQGIQTETPDKSSHDYELDTATGNRLRFHRYVFLAAPCGSFAGTRAGVLFPLVRFLYKSACDTRADNSSLLGHDDDSDGVGDVGDGGCDGGAGGNGDDGVGGGFVGSVVVVMVVVMVVVVVMVIMLVVVLVLGVMVVLMVVLVVLVMMVWGCWWW